jgi:hypothetical protein
VSRRALGHAFRFSPGGKESESHRCAAAGLVQWSELACGLVGISRRVAGPLHDAVAKTFIGPLKKWTGRMRKPAGQMAARNM